MSWQPYIDDHMMMPITPDGSATSLSSAAICGHDGSIWAQSETFPGFQGQEFHNIMQGFADNNSIAGSGLFIGGQKYMVIQGEPGQVIRGKKGSGGACVKKTEQCVVIGIYDEPVTPGQCNLVVEKLGDYLIESGY